MYEGKSSSKGKKINKKVGPGKKNIFSGEVIFEKWVETTSRNMGNENGHS